MTLLQRATQLGAGAAAGRQVLGSGVQRQRACGGMRRCRRDSRLQREDPVAASRAGRTCRYGSATLGAQGTVLSQAPLRSKNTRLKGSTRSKPAVGTAAGQQRVRQALVVKHSGWLRCRLSPHSFWAIATEAGISAAAGQLAMANLSGLRTYHTAPVPAGQ